MLINQIHRIGQAFYEGEQPVEIMIQMQNPVRSEDETQPPKIIVVVANITNLNDIQFKPDIIDYNPKKLNKYLLGLTSGSGKNYSLTLSPSWNGKAKDINFRKIKLISKTKLYKKTIFEVLREDYGDSATQLKILLEKVKQDENTLKKQISSLLKSEGHKNFNNPLIFKIRDKDGEKFLGEIPMMRRLYEYLFLGEMDKKYNGAKCNICGKTKSLREGFNLGLFTLDQTSFESAFFDRTTDFSCQYLMCTDCYLYTLLGFIIIKNNLQFFAYQIKQGQESIPIYHYIIPTVRDLKILKEQVEILNRAKKEYDDKEKKNITENILSLKENIESIKTKDKVRTPKQLERIKQDLEKRKKRQKNLLASISTSNKFNIEDLVINLYKQNKLIPIIDIYFKITNQKLNPKTKQIVSQINITSENIELLAVIFKEAIKKLEIKRIRLSSLKDLLPTRKFLHYYSSLLSLKPIERERYQQDCANILKSLFIKYINAKNIQTKKEYSYRKSLSIYELYNILFYEANLWR